MNQKAMMKQDIHLMKNFKQGNCCIYILFTLYTTKTSISSNVRLLLKKGT